MSLTSVVIVGAGHAGVQAAASLREEGWEGAIVFSPTKGPALSAPAAVEGFSQGADGSGRTAACARKNSSVDHRIDLRLGIKAERIDRAARLVELSSGASAAYDHLILATGARQRPLRARGVDLEGVFTLRAIRDAQAIRETLGAGRRVVVVGAGFIGLEIAATALALGGEVTVVEIADRPLGRAVSTEMSDSSCPRIARSARVPARRRRRGDSWARGRATAVELSTASRCPPTP